MLELGTLPGEVDRLGLRALELRLGLGDVRARRDAARYWFSVSRRERS